MRARFGDPGTLAVLSSMLFICLYALSLDKVPTVYSAETWLAQRNFALAETGEFSNPAFPKSYPEMGTAAPAWTSFYSAAFAQLGYSLFSTRLLPLLGFAAQLFFWFRVVAKFGGAWAGIAFIWIYALQLTVFHGAHIGRPEIPILFFLSLSTYIAVASSVRLSDRRRFFAVGLVGSGAAFLHIPGGFVPIVATLVGGFARGLKPRDFAGAGLAAGAGAAVMFVCYLAIADRDAVYWALFGDYANALAEMSKASANAPAWPEMIGRWLGMAVRGQWFAGPLYEGWVLTAGFVAWVIYGLWRSRRDTVVRRGLLAFLCGATLTLAIFSLAGHAPWPYLVYLTPWVSATLALAVSAGPARNPMWRLALAFTMVLLIFRLGLYLNYAWRETLDEYASALVAATPSGTVLSSTENHIVYAYSHPFVAIDDLRYVNVMSTDGTDPIEYLKEVGIDFVVIDQPFERLVQRPVNQPWGQQLLSYVRQHGRLLAVVPDPYMQQRTTWMLPTPISGILGTLRDVGRLPKVGETRVYAVLPDGDSAVHKYSTEET